MGQIHSEPQNSRFEARNQSTRKTVGGLADAILGRNASQREFDISEILPGKIFIRKFSNFYITKYNFPVIQIISNRNSILIFSSRAGIQSKDILLRLGITHVLSITTHELEHVNSSEITQKLIRIEDGTSTALLEYLQECWRFLNVALDAGHAALVQDEVGMSRSGAVVVSYLMKRERMSLKDAFTLVKIRRPIVTPAFAFVRQLRELECDLDPRERYNKMNYLVDYFRDFYHLRKTFTDEQIAEALERGRNDADSALVLLFESKLGTKRALRPPSLAET